MKKRRKDRLSRGLVTRRDLWGQSRTRRREGTKSSDPTREVTKVRPRVALQAAMRRAAYEGRLLDRGVIIMEPKTQTKLKTQLLHSRIGKRPVCVRHKGKEVTISPESVGYRVMGGMHSSLKKAHAAIVEVLGI